MAYRIETGRLDKAERTPSGGLRLPAAIGRTGVLEYRKADGGVWREYRPPEEAFHGDSLASLRGAPLTDLHPPRPVDPSTWNRFARGHVGDDARRDDDGKHIVASLYALDDSLIRGIEAGERAEVSAGYNVDLDITPGVTPEGERYDAVQRNVRYNHVAVGPPGWGRAGSSVALRLDSALNAITDPATDAGETPTDQENKPMKTERIDGVDYEVGSEAWAQARAKQDAARAEAQRKLEEELEAEKARADAAEKERDELQGRADSLEKQIAEAAEPKALDELVAARVALVDRARSLKADVKTDGLSDREIMAAALGLELADDITDDYLRGRFDAEATASERADGSLRNARKVAANAATTAKLSPAEAARRRMIERNRDAWKKREG